MCDSDPPEANAWVVVVDSGPGLVRIKSRRLLCDPVVKRWWRWCWYCE